MRKQIFLKLSVLLSNYFHFLPDIFVVSVIHEPYIAIGLSVIMLSKLRILKA